MTIKALKAKKHVLCDKPTALNATEAKQMVQTSKQHPNQMAIIDHELRFLPSVQKMRELIAANEIGDLFFCELKSTGYGRLNTHGYGWWFESKHGG